MMGTQDPTPDGADTPPSRSGSGGSGGGAGRLRLAGAAVLLGLFMIHHSLAGSSPAAVRPAMPPSAPTRLPIPQIGVYAPFTELTLDASGRLQPPPANDNNLVGWYRDAATPGERGTALVLGHVDTKLGPAVFWG